MKFSRLNAIAGVFGLGLSAALAQVQIQVQPNNAQVRVQVRAAPQMEETEEAADLPPEVTKAMEAAMAKWFEAITEPRKKVALEKLTKIIQEIAEETGLDEEGIERLKKAAPKAVEESMGPWKQGMREWMKKMTATMMAQSGADAQEMIEEMEESTAAMAEGEIDQMLKNMPAPKEGRPDAQQAWEDALVAVLSDKQLKAWKEEIAARDSAQQEVIDELIERATASAKKTFERKLEPALKILRNTIPLDQERSEALDELAAKAVAASVEQQKKAYRTLIESLPPEQAQQMARVRGNSIQVSDNDNDPAEQKIWKEGLAGLLKPDEFKDWEKAWEAHQAEEERKLGERIAKLIEGMTLRYRQQYGAQFEPTVTDIIETLSLDEERAKKLKAGADEAVDAFLEDWKAKAADFMKQQSAESRKNMMQHGYIGIGVDEDHLPENQETWKETLRTVLTEKEREIWETAVVERENRKKLTIARVVITTFGKRLGFTPEQMKKLEPVLVELASQHLSHYINREYWNLSTSALMSAFQRGDNEEFLELLNEDQKRHWQNMLEEYKQRGQRIQIEKEEAERPLPGPAPVHIEEAISAYLYAAARDYRDARLSEMTARAEDIARVTDLAPQKLGELRTAAKGAVHREMQDWGSHLGQWVRRSTKGATARDIHKRLNSLGRTSFQSDTKAEETEIWKQTINRVLTPAQQEAWRKTVERRDQYEHDVIIQLILTQLTSAAGLSSEQWDELTPLVRASLEKYGPDIERYFSSRSDRWYLSYYYGMIPFEGVPQKKAKEILSDEQWKVWETKYRPRVTNYWDTIQRYHTERTKKKEEKKKEL